MRIRAASYAEGWCTLRIALFLGAGASVPYGMPTTKDLWDKIRRDNPGLPRRDILDSGSFHDIEQVLSVLDQLIKFSESRAGKLYAGSGGGSPRHRSVNTIEDIFSMPSIRRHEAHAIIASAFKLHVRESHSLKKTIKQLVTRSYRWDPSHHRTAEKILKPLFDLSKSKEGHVTVFTTNYDTVIEEYCRNPGRRIECIDGFRPHGAGQAPVWDGKFAPRNDALPTKVFLYKLHGSMNWLAGASRGQEHIFQKLTTSALDGRASGMYIHPSLDAGDEVGQAEPYSTILRHFRRTLPSFNVCIVIGYSFRDACISDELVKFAGSGKLLVLLSPTAASDFETNALKGAPPTGSKGKWRGNDIIRVMELGPEDMHGGVCALNTSLDTYMADGTFDVIRSIIRQTTPGRNEAAGGR